MKPIVKRAIEELDKAAPTAPAEVKELRKEVRELRKSQEKTDKALEELKAKSVAEGKGDESKSAEKNEDGE